MQAIANLNRMFSLVRGTFALIGLAAVVTLALPVPHQAVWQHLTSVARADDSVSVVSAAGPIQGAPAATPQEREQRAVTEFIARRYRVSEAAAAGFVATAYQAGREFSLDPMLILAVMAVESRYNPVAESSMGARGLMQVIPKYHPEKLADHGGELALLDPEVNILVGTRILREYLRRVGALEAALQMYAGAADEPTSQYASKVLAEKARLQQVRMRARSQAARA